MQQAGRQALPWWRAHITASLTVDRALPPPSHPPSPWCIIGMQDMETWRGRDFENRMRVLRNEQQPATKPRYTALGFKKTRVPDDIFKIMWDRYKTGEEITEPWPKSDCHTNFFEARACLHA